MSSNFTTNNNHLLDDNMTIEIKETPVPDMLLLVQEMSKAHWDEVPFGNYKLELNLDVEQYIKLYELGYCKTVGAYDGDVLVGYVVVLAATMMQHQGVYQLSTDSFYVHPKYRALGVFAEMIEAVQTLCRDNNLPFMSFGVNPMFAGSDGVEEFLQSQGFSKTEVVWTRKVE